MGRKSKGGRASGGATIDKIEKYEDTLQEGGVDDCESGRESHLWSWECSAAMSWSL
jgi:hypothetical protein